MELDTAILAALERHAITRLIHFTPLVNLLGMLNCHAIMPMERVRAYALAHPESELLDYIQRNDKLRLDRRTDCINLSLQQPNFPLFRRFRLNLCNVMGVPDLAWCVLELDPTLCAYPGVNFTTTNAAANRARWGQGLTGFEALFATPTANAPRDQQAETLYPGDIPLSAIRAICVKDEKALRHFRFTIETEGIDPNSLPFQVNPIYFT